VVAAARRGRGGGRAGGSGGGGRGDAGRYRSCRCQGHEAMGGRARATPAGATAVDVEVMRPWAVGAVAVVEEVAGAMVVEAGGATPARCRSCRGRGHEATMGGGSGGFVWDLEERRTGLLLTRILTRYWMVCDTGCAHTQLWL
jgi:hypothetical protein